MMSLEYLYAYIISLPIFIAFDLLWLGVIAASFYRRQLGTLLGPIYWPGAALFYAVFALGLLIFATIPAFSEGQLTHALTYGALFGFFTYATYDLTNLATLRGWPRLLSFIDIVWGTFLSGTVSGMTYLVIVYLA